MDAAAAYRDAIARRRAFRLPNYATLADCGYDGGYVSPIQLSSGALNGPMLITKDWLDAPSAVAHRDVLSVRGFLPDMPFNRVLDRALEIAGLTRSDIYIAPIFCLLPPERSFALPLRDAKASFEAVVTHEIMGRTPIAAGKDAARVLSACGVAHVETIHPSARGHTFEQRAHRIAVALQEAGGCP